jgi:hypothetical protein
MPFVIARFEKTNSHDGKKIYLCSADVIDVWSSSYKKALSFQSTDAVDTFLHLNGHKIRKNNGVPIIDWIGLRHWYLSFKHGEDRREEIAFYDPNNLNWSSAQAQEVILNEVISFQKIKNKPLIDIAPAYYFSIPDPSYDAGKHFICSLCDNPHYLYWNKKTNNDLLERKLCLTCNIWYERSMSYYANDPNIAVIDHKYYQIGIEPPMKDIKKGYGSNKYVIEFFNGRRTISHNFSPQGSIPERWWSRLSDNAKFI